MAVVSAALVVSVVALVVLVFPFFTARLSRGFQDSWLVVVGIGSAIARLDSATGAALAMPSRKGTAYARRVLGRITKKKYKADICTDEYIKEGIRRKVREIL